MLIPEGDVPTFVIFFLSLLSDTQVETDLILPLAVSSNSTAIDDLPETIFANPPSALPNPPPNVTNGDKTLVFLKINYHSYLY